MSDLWPGAYISPPPNAAWRTSVPRPLVVLGSTGSIGQSVLAVVRAHPDRFRVLGLACATNVDLLATQAEEFTPPYLAVATEELRDRLLAHLPASFRPTILVGRAGYEEMAALREAGTVVSAQSGAAGLSATLSAVLAGKVVCLANKESLVVAGRLIRTICWRTGAAILPIDSEHNALFQCLAGRGSDVTSVILTASGGPFRDMRPEDLKNVTLAQALQHPNWSMGSKITIDSATMMNKGLEIMEAFHLYGLPLERIEVLIHRQSIVHSMVRLCDGSVLAQLAVPNMQLPIAHCLLWPTRGQSVVAPLDFSSVRELTFLPPDLRLYPCLAIATRALRAGDGFCALVNAANEAAVALFVRGEIPFCGIAELVSAAFTQACADPKLCADIFDASCAHIEDDALFARAVWQVRDRLMALDSTVRAFVRAHAERLFVRT